MNKDLVMVRASPKLANEELIDLMQAMKLVRDLPEPKHIVLFIGGFDDDPRELCQIPEARAFCRRLVSLGFISFLDVTADEQFGGPGPGGWGAIEVWMAAEGIAKGPRTDLSFKDFDRFTDVLSECNKVADKAVGLA